MDCPAGNLPLKLADLEINAPGGYGYAPLIDALASRFQVDSQSVVHANGTSMANHLAVAAVVARGDEVLIEAPTYEPLLAVADYFGGNVKRFKRHASDSFAIDIGEVERSMSARTRLIALTNLHNPTNALVDNETLRRIGELARSAGARVLVDEVYLEALYEPRPRSAFHLGNEFIATGSLTKAYGLSGLRCGWVLAEPDLAEQMRRLNDIYGVIPPHVVERLSVVALANLEGLAESVRPLLETNRKIFDAFVDSCPHVESRRPEFGTVVFPRLRSGDVDGLWELATGKYETTFVPGRFFEMPDHFRICIGCGSEVLSEGLRRLRLALDEFAGQRLRGQDG
jgi:aspartate/methionine/tyrosine aminotransferase